MKTCGVCGKPLTERNRCGYCKKHQWTAFKRREEMRSVTLADRRARKLVSRRCLRCDKMFPSSGPDNRICRKCKENPDSATWEGQRVGFARGRWVST